MKSNLLPILFFISLTSANLFAQESYLSDELIVFKTDVGDMTATLFPEQAPQHVEQILKLVRAGVYTNTLIFRVEKNFVAQIENYNMRAVPLTPEQLKLVKKIPGEFNNIPHKRGILSMARFDDPNSAETSFSFVLGDSPHLDKQYTVFGEVIGNKHVLDEIEKQPAKTLYIRSAEVIEKNQWQQKQPVSSAWSKLSSLQQIILMTFISLAGIAVFRKLVKS